VPQLEAPPAPPQGASAAGGAAGGATGGDDDGDDDGGSSGHSTGLSEEQEPEGWVARPITHDAARGCVNHLGPFGNVLVINDNYLWSNNSWRNKNAG
jgi:hypothetical protein